MYTPTHFASAEAWPRLLERHGFGLLVTAADDELWTTHLPYVVAGGGELLTLHMARANPHWQAIRSHPHCRFVVQGAHGYISPAWYETRAAVPTWNYEAVHLDGVAELVFDEETLWEGLGALALRFEEPEAREHWSLDDLSLEFRRPRLRNIVGVEFRVDAARAKQKLSQNRSLGERRRVVQELRSRHQHELASVMEALLPPEASD